MPDWHRNDQSIFTVIIVVVLVAAIAVLGVVGFRRYLQDERQEESIRKAAEEYNSSMLEARRKKAELEEELEILNRQGQIQVEGEGTIVFLCTEPYEQVYTDVRPILESAGYTGVVAFTNDLFPGEAGCMTKEEVLELEKAGWDVVVTAERNTNVKELFLKAKQAGFSPKGIYYPIQQIEESAETTARELGVRAMFTYSSDAEAADPAVYRILTLGCNENGIKKVTEDSIASSKAMALSIGFRNSRELYDETSVTNMVAFVKKNTDAGAVKVTDVEGAITGKNKVDRIMGESQKKTEGKRRELEAQIEELNAFILTGETAVAASETDASAGSSSETETLPRETVAIIISETEGAEPSMEGLTEPETETESETESETETTTEEKKTEPRTKAPETTAAKKKPRSQPTVQTPVIEETPGEVYVETPPEETKLTPREMESGTAWPDATYEYVSEGPGVDIR